MNDISAAIGIAGMKGIDKIIEYRNYLFSLYEKYLDDEHATLIGKSKDPDYYNSAWLATIYVNKDRLGLMKKLRDNNIESAQVHYRNDRYSVFGGRVDGLPNMDEYEDRYIVLPLHTKMSPDHVKKICKIINEGW